MAAVNYYIGLQRGQLGNPFVASNSAASAGTGADVELRMQINNGTNATGLTKKDVCWALLKMIEFIEANGVPGSGANRGLYLPAL